MKRDEVIKEGGGQKDSHCCFYLHPPRTFPSNDHLCESSRIHVQDILPMGKG